MKEFFINFRKTVQNSYRSIFFHFFLFPLPLKRGDRSEANFADSEKEFIKRPLLIKIMKFKFIILALILSILTVILSGPLKAFILFYYFI